MPLDHNSRNLNSSPWLLLTAVWVALLQPVQAQSNRREAKVRADRARVEAEGFWIYNQLELGWEQAKKQQRPLMVVLRCIPCEECVKLDDDLVDNHPALRPLLEQFVRVRVVSTNGLDLTRFQFDTDQSFAVFLFHPNGTLL
ncbi:MAG: thioredoxin family protein, partial [Pirellulaceae bacterium]